MTHKLVHSIRMPIRWGDMDAMGHVNNTVYFRYMEQARIAWFDQIGCAPDPKGEGPVIVNARCSFIKQLKYPGEIEVNALVGPPGRSSFEMVHEIRMVGADGAVAPQVCAEGGAKIVWVDSPAGTSAPLPDWVRALLPQAG
jgi:acyl-CoA thioester hydrolase